MNGITEGITQGRDSADAADGLESTRTSGPRYLMWFDDNPKLALNEKIDDAVAAYERRFAIRPNIVLINEAETVAYRGVAVCGVHFVRRHNFWVGHDQGVETRRQR